MPYVEKYNSAQITHDLYEGRTAVRVCDQISYASWNTAWVSLRDAHPDDSALICYRLTMKPQGQTSASAYNKVQVTAEYKIPNPSDRPPTDPYSPVSTVDLDFGIRAVTVANSKSGAVFTIDDDLNKIDVADASLYIPILTIIINQTTTSLDTQITDMMGRVNDDYVTIPSSGGFTFLGEQVRYDGCKAHNEINPEDTDSEIYYYAHQFVCICHAEATWNKVPVSYSTGYTATMEWEPLYPQLFTPVDMSDFLNDIGQSQGT